MSAFIMLFFYICLQLTECLGHNLIVIYSTMFLFNSHTFCFNLCYYLKISVFILPTNSPLFLAHCGINDLWFDALLKILSSRKKCMHQTLLGRQWPIWLVTVKIAQ